MTKITNLTPLTDKDVAELLNAIAKADVASKDKFEKLDTHGTTIKDIEDALDEAIADAIFGSILSQASTKSPSVPAGSIPLPFRPISIPKDLDAFTTEELEKEIKARSDKAKANRHDAIAEFKTTLSKAVKALNDAGVELEVGANKFDLTQFSTQVDGNLLTYKTSNLSNPFSYRGTQQSSF